MAKLVLVLWMVSRSKLDVEPVARPPILATWARAADEVAETVVANDVVGQLRANKESKESWTRVALCRAVQGLLVPAVWAVQQKLSALVLAVCFRCR